MEGQNQGYAQEGYPPGYLQGGQQNQGYVQGGQPQGYVQGGQQQGYVQGGQPQGYVQGGQQTVYMQGGQQVTNTTTVVTIANPGPGNRDWTYGLCGCFSNCGICLISYCVPCFVVGKNAEELGDSCLLYGLASFLFLPLVDFIVRRNIRARLGIVGSDVGDCLTVFCCTLCALVQERREVVDHMEMARQ